MALPFGLRSPPIIGILWQKYQYQKRDQKDMAYEFATYEKQGRMAIVTLNRPERLNALHPPAHFELHEIWNDFERDPEVWVGILTGTGDKAFSAGNDLKYTAEMSRLDPAEHDAGARDPHVVAVADA